MASPGDVLHVCITVYQQVQLFRDNNRVARKLGKAVDRCQDILVDIEKDDYGRKQGRDVKLSEAETEALIRMNSVLMDVDAKLGWLGKQAGIIRIALASVYQGTLAKLAEDVQDAYGELSLANRAAIKELRSRMERFELDVQALMQKTGLDSTQGRHGEVTKQVTAAQQGRMVEWKALWVEHALRKARAMLGKDVPLGSGGYGQVFMGMVGDMRYAIKIDKKRVEADGVTEPGQMDALKTRAVTTRFFGGGTKSNADLVILREARIMSGIEPHPFLIKLVGVCKAKACIVMEFAAGGDLGSRLRLKSAKRDRTRAMPRPGEPVELGWVARVKIAAQLALALQHLHGQQPVICHHDLKPGNILLDSAGCLPNVKLCDFGAAKKLMGHGGGAKTATQAVGGNVKEYADERYADPVYLLGNENPFGNRVPFRPHHDVYSFGLVLLQVVTGLDVTSPQFLAIRHAGASKSDVPDPRADWPPGVWRDLVRVARKCLADTDPTRQATGRGRPTATQLAEELVGIASQQGIQIVDEEHSASKKLSAAVPTANFWRSLRSLAKVAAAVTVLLLW